MKRKNTNREVGAIIDKDKIFLSHCESNRFDEALSLLPEVKNLNCQSSISKYTPLLHAISYENYHAAGEFIKKGANVNKIAGYSSDYKTCPLDLLASHAFTEEVGNLIKLILDNGGKLDLIVKGSDMVTRFVQEDNGKLINFLLKNNYITNTEPSIVSKFSVIKLATYILSKQVIRACLDNGIKPNVEELEAALSLRDDISEIISMIVQAGSNSTETDCNIEEKEVNCPDRLVIGDGEIPPSLVLGLL